ncbi:hypothetical protein E2C01_088910 [Portunus trituberculatus]|uniref:Uncharacterized protein n=1 Tax=Portunus trituberculatus TaxID=210409 RepID=A0A5B7JFX1_PORTR|nr:hypothetical protein [Portunus trituberculatus]
MWVWAWEVYMEGVSRFWPPSWPYPPALPGGNIAGNSTPTTAWGPRRSPTCTVGAPSSAVAAAVAHDTRSEGTPGCLKRKRKMVKKQDKNTNQQRFSSHDNTKPKEN